MTTPIQQRYTFLQPLENYGTNLAQSLLNLGSSINSNTTEINSIKTKNTEQDTSIQTNTNNITTNTNSITSINTKLSTYTKNADNVTLSQKLLFDQVYTLNDDKQAVQYKDFKELKQTVLGIDFVNNFESQLNAAGGIDDQLKLHNQKLSPLTHDETNNLVIVNKPLQSNSANQTTTENKNYITYFQHNSFKTTQETYNTTNDTNITNINNKITPLENVSGNNMILKADLLVKGQLKNNSASLIPSSVQDYVTKYYIDQQQTTQNQTNTDLQDQIQYITTQLTQQSVQVGELIQNSANLASSQNEFDPNINMTKLIKNQNNVDITAKANNYEIRVFGQDNGQVTINIYILRNNLQYQYKLNINSSKTNVDNFIAKLKTEAQISTSALYTYVDSSTFQIKNTLLLTANNQWYSIRYNQLSVKSSNSETTLYVKQQVFYSFESVSGYNSRIGEQLYWRTDLTSSSFGVLQGLRNVTVQSLRNFNQSLGNTSQLYLMPIIDSPQGNFYSLYCYYNYYYQQSALSSRYLKYNIQYQAPIGVLPKIMQLQPCTYIYKPINKQTNQLYSDEELQQNYSLIAKEQLHTGFLAQSVLEILPECTNQNVKLVDGSVKQLDNENTEIAINYNALTVKLIQGFQEFVNQYKLENQQLRQQLNETNLLLQKVISFNNLKYQQ